MDDDEVQAGINWAQNIKEHQRFLGLARNVLTTGQLWVNKTHQLLVTKYWKEFMNLFVCPIQSF